MLDASFPLVIPTLDSAGYLSPQKVGDVPYDTSKGNFAPLALPDVNPHAQVLPAATIYMLRVTNTHPSANLIAAITPTGNPQTSLVLSPGSGILLTDVPGGTGGWTAVSLQTDTAGSTYELGMSA